MKRVLLIFLDGVGVGENNPDVNPFARARLEAFNAPGVIMRPLDAQLGIPGIPQSGTGQTTLFTGINAAREFGRHFGPWVPTALRARLAQEGILARAQAAGRKVAFANAYPEELFTKSDNRSRIRGSTPVADPLSAGPPIVALGANVLNRHTPELARGDAVASEITNDGWRKHLQRDVPVITANEAGRNLTRIAAEHELTLFAHYSTDYVGHRGHMSEAVEAVEKVDEFLGGVLASLPANTHVAVVSDHGNLEDIRVGHTQNPALGLFFGDAHEDVAGQLNSLVDVAPKLLAYLGINTP
jgi:hypothetical protein